MIKSVVWVSCLHTFSQRSGHYFYSECLNTAKLPLNWTCVYARLVYSLTLFFFFILILFFLIKHHLASWADKGLTQGWPSSKNCQARLRRSQEVCFCPCFIFSFVTIPTLQLQKGANSLYQNSTVCQNGIGRKLIDFTCILWKLLTPWLWVWLRSSCCPISL